MRELLRDFLSLFQEGDIATEMFIECLLELLNLLW
jgi:hypothetical protein